MALIESPPEPAVPVERASETSVDAADRRLVAIDALRGLAALGVVLYHAVAAVPNQTNALELAVSHLLSHGFIGVWVFFVISGFCIHLRWARSLAAGEKPHLDFVRFWKKRFVRLYPAYAAALALYVVTEALYGRIRFDGFFAYDLLLHIGLVHNLDPRTTYTLNAVFWTLAIEEQLYLAYSLLLWLRARYGWAWTLLITLAARVGWFLLAWGVTRVVGIEMVVRESAAAHWFTWALGAFLVEAHFGCVRLPEWTRHRATVLCVFLAFLGMTLLYRDAEHGTRVERVLWLARDVVFGLFAFTVVSSAIAHEAWWRRASGAIGRLPLLGLFSYSLYLVHEIPFRMLSGHRGMPPQSGLKVQGWAVSGLAVVLALVLAGLFFRLVERPTLRAAQRL